MRWMQVLFEMLEQRGYTVSCSYEENYNKNYNDQIVQICDALYEGQTIKVYYGNTVCKQSFQTVINQILIQGHIQHIILIYNTNITFAVKNIILNIRNLDVEIFNTTELSINPLNHRLVPKHLRVTNTKELQELKNKKILSKLPIILSSDIISRFLFFKKGDIVKVLRPDNDGNFSIVYRICR